MARLKRPIEFGEFGADVLAIQQGLHRAGYDTNARNGNWATSPLPTMAAFQKDHGHSADRHDGADQPRHSLAAHERSAAAGGLHSYKPQAPAIHRALYSGDHGDDVRAVQRMLYRALGGQATNAKNGKYGQKTVNDMILFQRSYGIQGTGTIGQSTFARPGSSRTTTTRRSTGATRRRRRPTTRTASDRRCVSAARWSIANAGNSRYRQIRPYPRKLVLPS